MGRRLATPGGEPLGGWVGSFTTGKSTTLAARRGVVGRAPPWLAKAGWVGRGLALPLARAHPAPVLARRGWVGRPSFYTGQEEHHPGWQGGVGGVGPSFTTGPEHHPGCKAGWWVGLALPLGKSTTLQGGWVGRPSFTTGAEHHLAARRSTTLGLQGGVGGSARLWGSATLGKSTTWLVKAGWVGGLALTTWAEAGWVGRPAYPGTLAARRGGWVGLALPLGKSTTLAARRGGWVGLALPLGKSTTLAARRGGWVGLALPLGKSTTWLQAGLGGSASFTLGRAPPWCKAGGWVGLAFHWARAPPLAARRGGWVGLSFTTGKSTTLAARSTTAGLQGGVGGSASFTTGQEHHPGCKAGWVGRALLTGRAPLAARRVGGRLALPLGKSTTLAARRVVGRPSFTTGQEHHPGCKAGGWGRPSFTTGQEHHPGCGGWGGRLALPLGKSTTLAARRGGWVG
ncbi:hypothetical protein C0Q70_08657 [Pomacea canaliculata]|uniref:Uncharacterized protein n=1 Tax=Pomacea canaliculata TaxID=400727 RepID=A0A2T7P7P1_POMCA|nr:hypothetical protein C0Q70_08657 [Pomacea canaliculata]